MAGFVSAGSNLRRAAEPRQRPLRIWMPAVRAGSGADVFVERLAALLRSAGHMPLVQWFPHAAELAPSALKVIDPPPNVDLVHAGSWQGFAFKRHGLPLIITEHHDVMDANYRPYKSVVQHAYHRLMVDRWMRASFRKASVVTAVSNFTAAALDRRLGVHATAVSNWLEASEYGPPDSAANRAPGPFRLLFVGNMSRRKGGDVIHRLAPMLGASFSLICTGGLRSATSEKGSDVLQFLGRVSQQELIELYKSADAVLVPSRYEGFGYSALEAMASAKPVVGFGCTALREVLGSGLSQLLVPIDDIEGLAQSCRALAADSARQHELGVAGRQRALQVFSSETALSGYLAIYQQAIEHA